MASRTRQKFAAVVGDVRESRGFPNQRELLDAVFQALQEANALVPAAQPLKPTQGDAFQGAYVSLSAAFHVTLLVHLILWGKCQVRFGIGWGTISQPSQGDAGQSGTAWWAARAAIEEVASWEATRKKIPTGARALFRGPDREITALANAYLICRDEILRRFDVKDARITMGLLSSQSQTAIAAALGITQSSISARLRRKGIVALFKAHERFLTVLAALSP